MTSDTALAMARLYIAARYGDRLLVEPHGALLWLSCGVRNLRNLWFRTDGRLIVFTEDAAAMLAEIDGFAERHEIPALNEWTPT